MTPLGPAQALFKTVNRFVLQLELFRVYANIFAFWVAFHDRRLSESHAAYK
jgi:hypothetical protein